MNDIKQLEQVYQLTHEIKWPDNSEVYVSIGAYPLNGMTHVSMYVSPILDNRTSDDFGRYFQFIHGTLHELIAKLLERKKS